MVMMNLLRMLVDVSFYGAFAGLIARACGGSGAMFGMLIQCVCFALSCLGRGKRILRMTFLLPMVLGWVIYCHSLADCILLIPTAAYAVWLVWKEDYVLDNERQKVLFGVFWKGLIAVLIFGVLFGGVKALTAVTIPYSLIMLICSVVLMRALRHDPKIYCGTRYQVANLSAVALVVLAAGLLSTKAFLNSCAAVLKTVFTTLIQPIIELLLNLLLYIIAGIVELVSMLPFGGKEQETQEQPQMDLSGMENLFGEDIQLKQPSELLRILGIVFLAVAAIVLLVLFFRWINRRRGYAGGQITTRDERESLNVTRRAVRKREASPVRRIRALYRVFLKWCSGLNLPIEQSSTSLDVHRQVDMVSGQGEVSQQIRELYIKARYAEEADRDDIRKMKQLCDKLKKSDEGE